MRRQGDAPEANPNSAGVHIRTPRGSDVHAGEDTRSLSRIGLDELPIHGGITRSDPT